MGVFVAFDAATVLGTSQRIFFVRARAFSHNTGIHPSL
jgi:hypothetical protein